MSENNDNYYDSLDSFTDFDQFSNPKWYVTPPTDWYVVITDIIGSTKAIDEGRYKEVNALGAASIVAMLNAVKPLNVPYVFGGDGATLFIPESKKSAIEVALIATKRLAQDSFNMDLRIGIVPISEIVNSGSTIKIGKYQPNKDFQQAMFIGRGMEYAESLVKKSVKDNVFLINDSGRSVEANFDGFECRWSEIPSPKEENLTLMVMAIEKGDNNQKIYTVINQKIIEIYGSEDIHHPVRQEDLLLSLSTKDLKSEIKIKNQSQSFIKRWFYILKLKFVILAGKFLMLKKIKTKGTDWGLYKKKLIENTDYRKFDAVLRMVISGSVQQRNSLRVFLDEIKDAGKIVYGMHYSPNSLITCIISDYNTQHVHFLDGSNGGYALAAKEMKRQLKDLFP
jgi:hypothetical protein